MWININRDELERDIWLLGRFPGEAAAQQEWEYGWKIGAHGYVRSALMVLLADYCIRNELDPFDYEIDAFDPLGRRIDPAWTGEEYIARVAQEDRTRCTFTVKPRAGKES